MKWSLIIHGAIIGAILLFTFAPVISVAVAGEIAHRNGCDLDEGSIHPCIVNGTDIGPDLYTFAMLGWFMLATIPLGLGALLLYILAVGFYYLVKFVRKKRAAGAPA